MNVWSKITGFLSYLVKGSEKTSSFSAPLRISAPKDYTFDQLFDLYAEALSQSPLGSDYLFVLTTIRGKADWLTKSLINKLNDPDVKIKQAALSLLSKFPDPQATDSVIECLKDPNLKRGAIYFLSLYGIASPKVVMPLFELYKTEKDYLTRYEILNSLRVIVDPNIMSPDDVKRIQKVLNEHAKPGFHIEGDDEQNTLKSFVLMVKRKLDGIEK